MERRTALRNFSVAAIGLSLFVTGKLFARYPKLSFLFNPTLKSKTMTLDPQVLKKLHDTHIAAWNERDRTKRDSLLRTIYSENIKMYDPDTVFQNLTEVSDFIGKLHQQDSEFLFSEAKPIEATQNGVRLYGHIGSKQKPEVLNSMDFFIVEDGKVTHLYVFLAPAGK